MSISGVKPALGARRPHLGFLFGVFTMKRVFNSHSQVCHVWAQQTQSEGRAGNIFFNGTEIFSYGRHFLAAKVHTVKGKRVALVNSWRYSPSTGKHLSEIRGALRGLMPFFESSDVCDLRKASKELDATAQGTIASALKRIRIVNQRGIDCEFESITEAFKETNELRKLLGKAQIKPKKLDLDKVRAHLEKRLARYHELNTPEMIEKRAQESARRSARQAELVMEKQAESIRKWRNGESVHVYNLPHELLRIKGDIVQTSRGAEVPLSAARQLYRAIKAGQDVRGLEVGHFTVTSVTPVGDDRLVRIGCHSILLSEAARCLDRSPILELVKTISQVQSEVTA